MSKRRKQLEKKDANVELLKQKVRDLPNGDDELYGKNGLRMGKLNGGGVGRFKVLALIEEVFGK